MDNFLNGHHILKLNQSKINNLNRPIPFTEIESIIKNFPTKKHSAGVLLQNSTRISKKSY